jgi:2-polyprenyl-6-methoxyphenol hydroxylase-like FAD-dependent oxidoreductase
MSALHAKNKGICRMAATTIRSTANRRRSFCFLPISFVGDREPSHLDENAAIRGRRLFTSRSGGERLRVAVVGGGAAGLATALHLAPLVSSGLIAGPVDIFDAAGTPSREIGVGVWSTALDPFRKSGVDSHQLVYDDMIRNGTFVREVGYRTPRGDWLAESCLHGEGLPDLLFLREMDMLASLRKAVHLEVQRGNIALYSGTNYRVSSILEESKEPWSAPLLLETDGCGRPPVPSPRDYHLIVAADGMNSVLRKAYGGYLVQRRILTGTYAMGSSGPLDLPEANDQHASHSEEWAISGQAEATSTLDREYSVFRGNAPLTRDEIGLQKSFQTWGEGRNMRFATVPMEYPAGKMNGKKEERQVWFVTIDDDNIILESDPEKRRQLLLETFRDWHSPICQLVEATPANEILMERAMAHRHSMRPVVNFYGLIRSVRKLPVPLTSNGPAIQFVGDAFMTVDPILAQGFTFGMEGASSLSEALTSCLKENNSVWSNLAFDPYELRKELLHRHDLRLNRLICLLRTTEIVQALGQPATGTTSGFISRDIIRPMMRLMPGFVKTPIFNAMMKYSLGLR